ncbi:hypothetical protein PRIC1_010452 [Phytophthora ramorum]
MSARRRRRRRRRRGTGANQQTTETSETTETTEETTVTEEGESVTTGATRLVTSGSTETTETTEITTEETTETTEETEETSETTEETTTVTSEDVSRDSVTGLATSAIGVATVAATGAAIGSAVSATTRPATTSANVGSTEATETTEAVISEDVGDDVTRSVTERGDYAVTSGWTSGTGANQQTTETSETTETTEETTVTEEGESVTTGATRLVTSGSTETTETTEITTEETTETTEETEETSETTEETTTVTSEDVSRDSVTGLATSAIGVATVAATGAAIGSAVSATTRPATTSANVGSTEATETTEAVISEDVGDDVTRSVTERGDYAVTSGWTSGTGANQQTTETSETTETTEETTVTEEGESVTTGATRLVTSGSTETTETTEITTEETTETTEETEETSETTEETTTVTSEDVSRDSVTGLATSAIGVATVAATGAAIGSAVSATTRPATTSANVGSTEATETTEAVISEDVGDDVTRSVTERGDYAVTSGWTSGTGANQQTTETSETTETTEETTVTEEGESVTTGATRLVTSGSTETTETTEITTEETTETTEETEETSETTEETTTVTSEDVSRDSVTGLATSAIGVATVAATGAAIGSAVSATTRPATTSANVGSTEATETTEAVISEDVGDDVTRSVTERGDYAVTSGWTSGTGANQQTTETSETTETTEETTVTEEGESVTTGATRLVTSGSTETTETTEITTEETTETTEETEETSETTEETTTVTSEDVSRDSVTGLATSAIGVATVAATGAAIGSAVSATTRPATTSANVGSTEATETTEAVISEDVGDDVTRSVTERGDYAVTSGWTSGTGANQQTTETSETTETTEETTVTEEGESVTTGATRLVTSGSTETTETTEITTEETTETTEETEETSETTEETTTVTSEDVSRDSVTGLATSAIGVATVAATGAAIGSAVSATTRPATTSANVGSTEATETTEAVISEDVGDDVTRSVTERGDYAVTSGWTSGTGANQQTTETSETTETTEETTVTEEGESVTTGATRLVTSGSTETTETTEITTEETTETTEETEETSETTEETTTVTSEDVSRDSVTGLTTSAIGVATVAATGAAIGSAVSATTRPATTSANVGSTEATETTEAVISEDVGDDVTRSVTERGDYAVTSGWTSGTGANQQTTETSETTETTEETTVTEEGESVTTGATRLVTSGSTETTETTEITTEETTETTEETEEISETTEETTTVTSEDVSRDSVTGLATSAIGVATVAATGAAIGSAVSATTRPATTSANVGSTEATETTEAVISEDVGDDVTRSVTERGDYAVTSGWTSGTGANQQTTETSETTETTEETTVTEEGESVTTGATRLVTSGSTETTETTEITTEETTETTEETEETSETTEETTTVTSEDVSRDSVTGLATSAIGVATVAATGAAIGSAVSATTRPATTSANVGSTEATETTEETTVTEEGESVTTGATRLVTSGSTETTETTEITTEETTETTEETTETTEETSETTEETTTVTSEDVSRDSVTGLATSAIGVATVAATGAAIGSAVSATTRPATTSANVGSTEATETTEAVISEDVGDDVTRSVTERGDYAVTSGWTSGTGANQQTTETSETTETTEETTVTEEGESVTTGATRLVTSGSTETTETTEITTEETTETTEETEETSETTEETTTVTSEDVSRDSVTGLATSAIGVATVAATGAAIGSAVSATTRPATTSANVGSTEATETTEETTVTEEGESVTTGATRLVTSGSTETTETTEITTEETTETTEETTETTEETSETTEETTTVTSEDVSRDSVTGLATSAIGVATVAATGAAIGSAVSATTRPATTSANVGSTGVLKTLASGSVASRRLGGAKMEYEKTLVVIGLAGSTMAESKLRKVKEVSFGWSWLSQFVSFCEKWGKDVSAISPDELRELSRDFCSKSFSTFSENLYENGSRDEKRAAWNVSQTLSVHFPELAVHQFGVEFGQHKRILMIDEVASEDKKTTKAASPEVLTSMLKESPELSGDYEHVLITEGGETVFYGSAKSLMTFFQEFGFAKPQSIDFGEFLLGLSANGNAQYHVTVIDGANKEKENQQTQSLSSFVSFADDSVLFAGSDFSAQIEKPMNDDNQISSGIQTSSTAHRSTSETERASAGSVTVRSAESGGESSAALVAAGTAAMSSLYARYAREGSSVESMTFSADIDAAAQEIQRVCTGAASDETALASLLLSKTAEQRYLIWWRYRILYKQSLTVWVKSTSDYGILLKMLASPLEHVEAEILRKATKGLGTTEEWIYPVVMARSNAEIALLKKTFQEKYGDDLVQILRGELSGDLKKVILTAIRGEVADFDASVHTSAKAAADADVLYKAGEGRVGTDETTFINILVLSPAEHLRSINRAYVAKYKTDLVSAVTAEFSGDAKRALLFLVRSVVEPVELLAELFETTLKGAGKSAYGLSAWVVRYYGLLVRIRIVYMRLYRQELRSRIQSVVSGEYCQLLLSVFDAAEVEFGASASGSASIAAGDATMSGTAVSSTAVSGSSAVVSRAAVGVSTSVEEKASISSSGAGVSASETERASAGSVTVRSAESGGESSAALVAAGTAAMSSLYARYAREGSSVESMTFSADIDAAAQEIQRVCTGAASDETALASLLLSKTAEQRYLIWWRYRILYKQSLTVWVKSTSDYGILLKMLASPLEHVEAEILRKATKGLGTTEEWIYPVVMARSNAEIALLKKTFQEKYGDDLVQILRGELSGDLKKVILTAIRGEVADFDASVHTSAKAAADADVLYKAGEGRVGTDETTFINILVLSPAEHLRSINRAYVAKYKTDLVSAVTAEFSGDAKRALLFLVRSVVEPVELLAELFETTLKGAGKSAYGLSAWVVRYYGLLVRIRIVYMRLYRQELRSRIQSVVSGEYCQLLLSVFDAAEVEFGASASGSASIAAGDATMSGTAVSSTAVSGSSAVVSRAAVGVSTSVEEKASISSSGAGVSASETERASAGSVTVRSAESGGESSAALVAAGTAAMSSLYARYAREGSSVESMTFSADIDAAAQEIQRVCTGAASDETALASLLLSKTAEQRYLIWWRYRILYKQSLTVWVKSTSDYGILLKMLASPLEHVEAEILRKATKGLGTTEEWIYPVVMARSNAEIALLKKTFQEKYGDDLVQILRGELSGDLKKVILTAIRGEVADFDASVHTSAKAAADADVLYKAGEGRVGTDETTFINILVLSPAEHLRSINRAYVAKYKTDLVSAVTAEFSGDAKRALLFLVRSVVEPVELLAELFETTLKGAGKSAYGLSAWVVRYYGLLVRIRIVYMRLYRQELRSRIQSVVSGEYCQLLLSVFDAAEVEFGASASGSASIAAGDATMSGTAVSSTAVSGSSAVVSRAAVGVSTSVEEKASISSSGAGVSASETERASAGSVTVRSAESGGESSAALVAAGTAAMSSLYARYAREGSSVESMTFSADIDAAAQEIQRVCTGAASDETALASLLLSKTAEQRYLIWWRYRILYKQSLTVWVKSTSDYGILLKMLASPLEHVEAEILRKATKGLGTTEEWIYPVVMARSNAEIALLKKTFQEKYGDDLVQILRGELSGDLKKVILTAIRGEVADFDASVHTSAKAAADADVLYKAGEGRVGTDETTFINILVLSPAEHLRSINRAYVAKYKTDLVSAVTAEFSGDAKRALLFLVRSVVEPVELLAELFETTLKGAGKSAYGLSAWVVRYYGLLVRIRIVYMRLYRQELRSRIQSVVSGEYCQLLLSVFDAAEVEFGASASGSASIAAGDATMSGTAVSSTAVSGSSAVVSRAAVGVSTSVEEKASISSSGAGVSASETERASAGSVTVRSAESGGESSAALVAAGTAAMSSLYARYAREGSSVESMTFSADIDAAAQEIQRVCTGAASDETALASLLLSKTAEQRYLIWWRYRILYKQSLTVWVKSTSDYGILLKMLASPLEHVEAEILRKATKGLGTTEEWIYPVVMARSNAEIALLKKTFQEKYGDDLVQILRGELSGDLKKVILTAIRGEVADFDASVHTSAKAAADADVLYKAGEGRVGTDETTFINILVLSPAEHLRSINRAYVAKYKTDLVSAVTAEFSGDAKRALLFLVRSVVEPVELLAELFETTLKGAGKSAYGLSAWVVRYYGLLVRIRIVYMRLYRQELRSRIQSVVSGEYCQLLLSVFDAAEVEFGASASGSASIAAGDATMSGTAVSSTAVSGSSAVVSRAAVGVSTSVEEKASISSSGATAQKNVSAVTTLSSTIVRSVGFGNLYAQSSHDIAGGASLTLYGDIDSVVEEIKAKCSGAETDEKALASILVPKTAEQRYLIWWRYRILYKQSLTVWVKSTSDYGILLKMLASPLEHVEAEILRKATKGLGTTEEWIYPVVMARSNAEIAMLKKTYRELYGEDLVSVLRGELSGDLKKVVMAAMQGDLPSFDPAVYTSARAAADADALYKAGEGKWGTEEETFIRIVVSSPAQHLRNIDAAYSKKYKKTSIVKAIKGEFKGDAQAALLYHVRMAFEPFELLAELFESTMKGLGTDEYGLSAAVVRYHVLLPQIKTAYKKLFGKELSKRIRGDTSGEYRDMLLAIVDGQ